jgi:hypothetical protein
MSEADQEAAIALSELEKEYAKKHEGQLAGAVLALARLQVLVALG